jgi:hypothetical protein
LASAFDCDRGDAGSLIRGAQLNPSRVRWVSGKEREPRGINVKAEILDRGAGL